MKKKINSDKNINDRIYLSNLSHEVRTPMNAIIGISEHLLRNAKTIEEREQLNAMKFATQGLLMTINNLLDYEQLSNNGLTTKAVEFDPLIMLLEVVEISRINIDDKKVTFLADICDGLPKTILGDGDRVKQVLVHLIGNAAKFTEEGFIKLIVTKEVKGDSIDLHFEVSDTGIGMDSDTVERVFKPFEQGEVSAARHEGGLGIGLTIAKEFLNGCDSELIVESEIGKGSSFSFTINFPIVAGFEEPPFENKNKVSVAVYFHDKIVSAAVCKILESMSVSYDVISGPGDLFLSRDKEFTHLFMDYDYYSHMSKLQEIQQLKLRLICACSYNVDIPRNTRDLFLRLPVVLPDVYNCISGVADEGLISTLSLKDSDLSFTLPGVRLLIVDDNVINIKVTENILKPYEVIVDSASSGEEALKLVKRSKYDLVFMDHMMPGMDGVETTRIIRQFREPYFMSLPIIALTANVVEGAEKLFDSAGMNDILTKPVEVDALEAILKKWIPKEKIKVKAGISNERGPEVENEFINFKYIRADKGLSYSGGSVEMYKSVLLDFAKGLPDRKAFIESLCKSEDVGRYTIEVHSLKSLSKTIGAMELSEIAQSLERMGHARDLDGIRGQNDALLKEIDNVLSDLEPFCGIEKEETVKLPFERESIRNSLREMYVAMDDFDYDVAERVVKDISCYELEQDLQGLFDNLKECVSNIDYSGAKSQALEFIAYLG